MGSGNIGIIWFLLGILSHLILKLNVVLYMLVRYVTHRVKTICMVQIKSAVTSIIDKKATGNEVLIVHWSYLLSYESIFQSTITNENSKIIIVPLFLQLKFCAVNVKQRHEPLFFNHKILAYEFINTSPIPNY